MDIVISFNEIKKFISDKTNGKVDLNFFYLNSTTLSVSYKPLPILPSINIELSIDMVCNSIINLTYSSSTAVDKVIQSLYDYIKHYINGKVIELDTSNHTISIDLNQVDQLRKILEIIILDNIYFDNNIVIANIKLNK